MHKVEIQCSIDPNTETVTFSVREPLMLKPTVVDVPGSVMDMAYMHLLTLRIAKQAGANGLTTAPSTLTGKSV